VWRDESGDVQEPTISGQSIFTLLACVICYFWRLQVKQTWGELIMKTKQWDIYVAMRARVALRKAGMPLPIEDVEEEMRKIRSNNGRFVTVKDIISAFECGEEVIVPF